jgi:putative drug exporter of the RND superfamily
MNAHATHGTTLGRLASWCYRRRRRVLALWAIALVAAVTLTSVAGGEHRVDYSMPGSESAAVRDLLVERFPDRSGDLLFAVAHAPDGVDDPALVPVLEDLAGDLRAMPHVAAVDGALRSPDGRTALVPVTLDDRAEAVPGRAVLDVVDRIAAASGPGLQTEAGGWPVQYAEQEESGGKEGIGLVAALAILLLAFGSLLAAGIPILLALIGIGVGSAIAMQAAHVLDVPEWGSMLATMIGIGVGIDYALFIVTGYRTALQQGDAPHEAVVRAMTTSGRAVLFAGGTVIVSLLGLGAIGLDYMWGAALAMVLGVVGVLAATSTLLPAVLGFAGDRIDRFRLPGLHRRDDRSARWARWSTAVQGRPVLSGAVALVLLLALAAPIFDMRFGFPDAGTGTEELTSRRAFDLTAEAFGPGANGPLVVAVDAADAPAGAAPVAGAVAERLRADRAVAAVLPGMADDQGHTALLTVVPTGGPQDPATESLVRRLRADVLPDVVGERGATASVGGLTALFIDEADHEASRLPWFIGAVLALSFCLLLVVFRAPLIALKAAVLNLLGIGASYGIIATAVQGGWFGQLIGIPEPTPIPVFIPILMFALLFGLSMDYEVFLLSRIREEHLAGATNSDAVVEGLARTARVITAAAAIMIVVFGAFMLNDEVVLKLAGLGLASAVLIDATIVRMVLVPATMELLGERNWWTPRWLDRRLPHLHLEGEPRPVTSIDPIGATP